MRIGQTGNLSDLIRQRRDSVSYRVDRFYESEFSSLSDAAIVELLAEEFSFETVEIRFDSKTGQAREESIDMSGDPRYHFPGRPARADGTLVRLRIPFTGDSELLTHQATIFWRGGPEVEVDVGASCLWMNYRTITDDPEEFNRWWIQQADMLRTIERNVNAEATNFNGELAALATAAIVRRRTRLNSKNALMTAIGLERRIDAPTVAPVVRKNIVVAPLKAAPASPANLILEEQAYSDILETLKSMGSALERNPKTFSKLKEEEIRDFLLVILNATYQGDAVGETFNSEGKTDILIRRADKNVFIAELKMWSGRAALHKAIDQLLGYLSFRDTRTALIVFVRNRTNVTAAVRSCIEAVRSHPAVEGDPVGLDLSSRADFVVRPPNDSEKIVRLALLPFVIPTE